MRAFVLSAARALVAVLVAALVADGLLGLLTGAVSSLSGGAEAPWWITGHVADRARWLVFGLLALGAARWTPLASMLDAPHPRSAAWRVVGVLAVTVPLLWLAALWIVQAALFTAFDRWAVDGQAYLGADYLRRVVAGYAPWLLGGVACLVASRHVE